MALFTRIPHRAADQKSGERIQLTDFYTRTMALIVAEIINVRTRDIAALGGNVFMHAMKGVAAETPYDNSNDLPSTVTDISPSTRREGRYL